MGTPDSGKFVKNLLLIMEERGITQAWIANKAKISKSNLSQSIKRESIGEETKYKIAAALNMEVADIYKWKPSVENNQTRGLELVPDEIREIWKAIGAIEKELESITKKLESTNHPTQRMGSNRQANNL